MRIAIDTRSIMEPYYTGVAEYTFQLLDHLFKIDQKNEYKLFYNSYSDVKKYLPRWNYPNVKWQGFKYPNKLFNASLTFFNYPKIDRLIGGADVFFLPNLSFASLSGACKSVITVHDLSFERFPEFYNLKSRLWHKVIRPKKLLPRAHKIIAVSESTKNDLRELYGISEERIKVIYSGVEQNVQVNEQALKDVQQKYDLPDNFILSLSTLEPRKNIEGIIKAFDKLPDNVQKNVHLVITGPRGWKYKQIFKLAKSVRCADKIKFIDYIDPKDKPALYKLAGIFVYPSFYEGFGFPPLEAMSAGCPVITSFASSLPEVAGDAAILVDPYNIYEITEALEQVLRDEKLRDILGKKGLENIKRFKWERAARETLEALAA